MKAKKAAIIILSIIIPVAVGFLLNLDRVLPESTLNSIRSIDGSFLPPIYAGINFITFLILILALIVVKRKMYSMHEGLIKLAMTLSVLFLLGYIMYHLTTAETLYGDVNHDGTRSEDELALVAKSIQIYFFILISHVILSMVVIPLVLFSYLFGITDQRVKHKKIVKIAYPIWLYITISGVVVYYMISPYYV